MLSNPNYTGCFHQDVGELHRQHPDIPLVHLKKVVALAYKTLPLSSYPHGSPSVTYGDITSRPVVPEIEIMAINDILVPKTFSLCLCFWNKHGYVMASDSRRFIYNDFGCMESFADDAQKIVYNKDAKCAVIGACAFTDSSDDIPQKMNLSESRLKSRATYLNFVEFLQATENIANISNHFCFAGLNCLNTNDVLSCDFDEHGFIISNANHCWYHVPAGNETLFHAICGVPFDVAIHQMSLAELVDFARAIVNAYKAACEHRRSLQLSTSCTPSGYVSPIGGPVQLLAVDGNGRVVVDETDPKKGR